MDITVLSLDLPFGLGSIITCIVKNGMDCFLKCHVGFGGWGKSRILVVGLGWTTGWAVEIG